jgi:hypothetical protein
VVCYAMLCDAMHSVAVDSDVVLWCSAVLCSVV